MRECFRARGEAHVLAEVVAALGTVRARPALDASFDCYTLTDVEARGCSAGADGGDNTGCLMTENERCLEGEITIAAVEVVVHCGMR